MRNSSFYSDYMSIRRQALRFVRELNRETGAKVLTPAEGIKIVLENIFPQLRDLESPSVFVFLDGRSGQYVIDAAKERPRTGILSHRKLNRAFVSKLLRRELRYGEAVLLEFIRRKQTGSRRA